LRGGIVQLKRGTILGFFSYRVRRELRVVEWREYADGGVELNIECCVDTE
jgi:hypothetical protein